jgi:hypothetical protein
MNMAKGGAQVDQAERKVPNDSPPDSQREAEIEQTISDNENARRPACAGLYIATRGELTWLLGKREWSGEFDVTGQSRADLREVVLSGTILGNVNLNGANLQGARLNGTDLHGANLFQTNLANADLRRADLSEAFLPHADLRDTDLERTNLRGARLLEVNLSGAYLERTDLRGADLWSSRMDVSTMLREVTIDTNTRFGDVLWNGVSLTQVDWKLAPTLGDERAVEEWRTRLSRARGRQERTELRMQLAAVCRDTQRAYRTLAIALRSQGLAEAASTYRLCEQRLERAALRAERRRAQLLFSRLLNVVSGYGERPQNAVVAYLAVILAFSGFYWGITHVVETKLHALSVDEALVLSLTSFHGRGFFPGSLPLGDWVARVGAAEAIIGLFIELIFIATFSRRFLGN